MRQLVNLSVFLFVILLASGAEAAANHWYVLTKVPRHGAGFNYSLFRHEVSGALRFEYTFGTIEGWEYAQVIEVPGQQPIVIAVGEHSRDLYRAEFGKTSVIGSSIQVAGRPGNDVIPFMNLSGQLAYFDLTTLAMKRTSHVLNYSRDVVRVVERALGGERILLREYSLHRQAGNIPVHQPANLSGNRPLNGSTYTVSKAFDLWADDKYAWVLAEGILGAHRGLILIPFSITQAGFVDLGPVGLPSNFADIQFISLDNATGELVLRNGTDLLQVSRTSYGYAVQLLGGMFFDHKRLQATSTNFPGPQHGFEVLPGIAQVTAAATTTVAPSLQSTQISTDDVGAETTEIPAVTNAMTSQEMTKLLEGAWKRWQAKRAKAPFPNQIDAKTLAAFVNDNSQPDLLPLFKGMEYSDLRALDLELRTGTLYCPSNGLVGKIITVHELSALLTNVANKLDCAAQIRKAA